MKTKLFFLITLLFSFYINAQIDFEPHITVDDTGGTNNPRSVYAADLDGDGDLDMLSVSNSDNKIAWYKNSDGLGNFGPQQIISENYEGAASVFAADVDNDGDIDVLAAAGGRLLWFKNSNGQGNFGNAQDISSEIGAISIFAADFDNDGDMDILGASNIQNNIFWFENIDGLGNFGPQIIVETGFDYPIAARAIDIDGDGDNDILTADSYGDNDVIWFKNTNGLGNFVQQQALTTDIRNPQDAIAADIDGDGDLDIVVSSRKLEGFRVIWFENTNGLGNFDPTPNLIDMPFGYNPTKLLATDFDNDNDLDIVVGNDHNIGVVWYKNNGNGTFGNKLSIDDEIENITSLFASDLDNDGDADLLLSSGTGDRVAWHKNTNGQGNFGPANELADINGANGPYQLQSADIDGDGDKDIIAALAYDNRVVWQENLDGQGNFSELREIGTLKDAVAVFSGDVDGDGKMDVLASGKNKLVWHRNTDGQGTFGTEQIIYNEPNSYPETIYLSDIDSDGDLDVFSYANIQIFWQENNGTGSFGPIQIISTGFYGCDSIVAADIDNDGDKDLFASDWAGGQVVWHENTNGQGNFGAANVIDTLIAPDQVDVADFDNDGDMDIVTLDYATDEVMWYENMDGQGAFGSRQIISNTIDRPFSLKATDIDADGDMDVLATSYSTATLWLFQNQDGNFNNGQPFTSEVQAPIFITADDFNGDGKMDVLAPSYSKDEIIWFENKGPLSIEESTANLFSIYPNPTNGLLIINSASTVSEISVYNNLGQLLLTSEKTDQVDISSLSDGIYFVKIKAENGQTETKKVVKK
jgi:hypothetical protein